MLGRIIDSLRGPGDAPRGRGKWPRIVPLVGAVVLIPMLASAVAQAFQARGTEEAAALQAAKPDDQKPVVVKRGAEKPAAGRPGGFFTGSAGVDRLFPAEEPSRVAIASVTFEPGPDGVALAPARPDAGRDGRYRLGAGLGRQGPGDQGGRRRPYSAESEALARCHGDHAHETHLRRRASRRQERRGDGAGQRRAVPALIVPQARLARTSTASLTSHQPGPQKPRVLSR